MHDSLSNYASSPTTLRRKFSSNSQLVETSLYRSNKTLVRNFTMFSEAKTIILGI